MQLRFNPYTQQIIKLAIPIVSSLLLQVAYNLTDIFWVGKVGSDAVAAVGSAGFFLHLGMAICAIVSVGSAIKVSHAIGARNIKERNHYSAAALVMGVLIGLAYALCTIFFAEEMIGVLQIENHGVFRLAVQYLQIISIGIPFFCLSIVFTGIVNAKKLTKISMMAVVYGNGLNIILDPIFIIVLDLGVHGAAFATVLAWLVSFGYFVIKIFRVKLITFWFKGLKLKTYLNIMRVGSAASMQRILFSLISIVIGGIIATFGSDAIAAQKLGLQIEGLTFMIVAGINQALSIMVGQSYGARRLEDVSYYYSSTMKLALWLSVFTTILFLGIPEQLIAIFVDDAETIHIGAMYLRIVGLSQIFMTIEMVTTGGFNGLGLTHYSASISIIFTTIRIPIAIWLSSTSLGINGVWVSISATSVLKGIISYAVYKFKYASMLKNNTQV